MPLTHVTFLIACLAIAGIPPFSGFFSKEEILFAAFDSNKFIYGVALFTSALTAFYMFRLYFSIFWKKEAHLHDMHGEGTMSMKIPLVMLAAGSLLAGLIPFSHFVTSDGVPLETHIDIGFSIAPVLLALGSALLANSLYRKENNKPAKIAASLGSLYKVAYKKFYIDEVYMFITRKIIFNLVGRPAAWTDKNIVDGFMNLLALLTAKSSSFIKGFQSGKIQNYTLYFFAGIAILALFFIYLWK